MSAPVCAGGSITSRGAVMRSASIALAIFVAAFCLLFIRIGQRREMVFDEQYYVGAARAFLAHASARNVEHPPVGKYLIAAGMGRFGDNPVGWRIAPVLCGGFALVAVFWWCELLLENRRLALLAVLLTAANGFWFVLARTAMLEIFVFTFSIWAVLAYTAALKLPCSVSVRRALLLAAGVLFGLAVGCKWNALVGLAVTQAISVTLLTVGRSSLAGRNLSSAGLGCTLCALWLAPALIYVAAYLPLYHAAGKPFTLADMVAMHRWMVNYHSHSPGDPALALPWYQWVIRTAPQHAPDYLVGNIVIVWAGLVAVVVCIYRAIRRLEFAEIVIVLFYLANLLVWAIAPRPFTYYYYYGFASMFLGPMIAAAFRGVPAVFGIRPALVLALAATVVFLGYYPAMVGLNAAWTCVLGCR